MSPYLRMYLRAHQTAVLQAFRYIWKEALSACRIHTVCSGVSCMWNGQDDGPVGGCSHACGDGRWRDDDVSPILSCVCRAQISRNLESSPSLCQTLYLYEAEECGTVSRLASTLECLSHSRRCAGVGNIVWMAGSVIGAPLGGYMADTVGWRMSFLFQIPLALLAFGAVGALLNIPGHRKVALENKLRRIDFVGSFCLIATVASLLVTLDRGGDVGWTNPQTTIPFGIFAVFLCALIVTERNFAREPVIPGKTLTNPTYLVIYLSNMVSRGTIISTTFYISLYIRAVSGKTAAQAGYALLPSILGGLAGSLIGGRYTQATGRFKRITVMLNAGMVMGSLFIALFTGVLGHVYVALELGTCAFAHKHIRLIPIHRILPCGDCQWCDVFAFARDSVILMDLSTGCAMNTTLVSLVAEAGPEEQAVASGGEFILNVVVRAPG